MTLFYVFAAVIAIFSLIIASKRWVPHRLCAICAAISLTWGTLLVLYHLNYFEDSTIIAALMGGSVVAGYYLFDQKAPERLLIFRLPVLLSLFYAIYVTLTLQAALPAAVLLAGLWLILAGAYHYRNKPELQGAVKHLIECCSKW